MNYFYSVLLLAVIQLIGLSYAAGASTTGIVKDTIPFQCGQQDAHDDLLNQYPDVLERQNKWETERKARAQSNKQAVRRAGPYEIPVVVHIIHDNGAENLSDAEVAQGIRYLNEGFGASGPYGSMGGTDTELTFRLAERDPDNNPTIGINRVTSGLTEMLKSQDLDVKNLIRWDPTCYVNIWLVREICKTPGDCGIAGYAYFPSAHGMDVDGIMMEARHFASSPESAVVTIHELGHYLGLYHTFAGGCKNDDCLSDGDRVCDTPPDQSTARVSCVDGANSCSSDVNSSDPNNPFTSDENDQMENFMDYASCSVLFTGGQKTRMVDALENVRFSLIDTDRCPVFCSSPVTANFTASTTTIFAGETVAFTDLSAGSASSIWTIDNVPFSGSSFTFNDVGIFTVLLQITGMDQACRDEFSLSITVKCPVEADFTVSTTQADLSEIVNFTNVSINGINYEWTVNNVVVSNAADFDFSSATAGIYTVCLIAENTVCQDKKCQRILVSDGAPCTGPNCEDCTNGIDDNGDGLVDFFDPDCPCIAEPSCGAPFYNPCIQNCTQPNPLDTLHLDVNYTGFTTDRKTFMMAADFDGDCNPDICARTGGRLLGVFGQTGEKYSLPRSFSTYGMTAADVDNDGAAEIFAMSVIAPRTLAIWRIDYNPVLNILEKTWESSIPFDNEGVYIFSQNIIPSVADFNHDGIPEIYVGNQIFDSETGLFLGSPGTGFNTGSVIRTDGTKAGIHTTSVAVDLLSDSACADCGGLELAAGNQVFSVALNSRTNPALNEIKVVRELPGYRDGATAIVDFDLDGDVDIVVAGVKNGNGQLYIWDAQTAVQIGQDAEFFAAEISGASTPSIGDLDGDGRPEIAIKGHRYITTLEDYQTGGGTNWGSNMTQTTLGSNIAAEDHPIGMTLFDFNLDGKQEIVTRTQWGLFLFDANMNVLARDENIHSPTELSEIPIIIDWDDDGEAEILTYGCNDNGVLFPNDCPGELIVVESASFQWANTRKVQNQFAYTNTNINDDGTVPTQQQLPHLLNDPALNSYNLQYAFPTPLDAEASSELVDARCSTDGIEIDFEICNNGDRSLPVSTPVTIYDGNPTQTNAPLLLTFELPTELFPNECITLSDTVSASQDSIFVVVNDNGTLPRPFSLAGPFPPTSIQECEYADNISGIAVPRGNPPLLDLGPDILICDNGIFPLDAGPGFTSYRWSDASFESSITVYEPGIYWVETTDLCGTVQTDTIVIQINPLTEVSLGTDLTVCEGDTLQFDAGVFDSYKWLPRSTVDCDTCRAYSLKVTRDTQVVVQVQSDLGCISLDTIDVFVSVAPTQFDSLSICLGDTVLIDGTAYYSDTLLTQRFSSIAGCDSILTTRIVVSDSIFVNERIEICAGDTLMVFGTEITRDSTLFEAYTSTFGCDSIYEVRVEFRPTLSGSEVLTFCEGDTAMVFGIQLTASDTVSETLTSIDGCDSLTTVEVIFNPTIETFERIEYCAGDTATLFGNVLTQNGTVNQLSTSITGCDSTHNIEVVFVAEIERMIFDSLCDGEFLLFFNDTITETGTYVQTVSSLTGDCDTNYVLTADFFEDPIVSLIADTVIAVGEAFEIPLNIFDPTLQITWLPNQLLSCTNCTNPTVSITEETSFEAAISNSQGCSVTTRINIRVFGETGSYVPNGFSPNNDLINDVFTIYFRNQKRVDQLQIYDRWGELVFELNNFMSNQLTEGWDGTHKDLPVNPGVFVYQILVKDDDGEQEILTGDVTVVR